MKGTTLLPINMNISTPENIYNKIKILQSREEKEIFTEKLGLLWEKSNKSKRRMNYGKEKYGNHRGSFYYE